MEAKNQLTPRELFGGAITMGVPLRFNDASKFRQIPDNQEVFADPKTDQSVIVELLDVAEEEPDARSSVFHFNSIAHDNAATAQELETEPLVSELPGGIGTRSVVWGIQRIAKFNEAATNDIRVFVCCYRLRNVSSDVVISFNSPVQISGNSSSAKDLDRAEAVGLNDDAASSALFQNLINSLNVVDYGLFG